MNEMKGILLRNNIIDFVDEYHEQHGYMPSYQEIGNGVGLKSKASVFHHMKILFDEKVFVTDFESYSKFPRAFRFTRKEDL